MSETTKPPAGLIYSALARIMDDAKAIGKDSNNQQQGFKFRGIEAVMNHLHPLFAKHGVIVLPEVLAERTEERQTKSGGNLIYRVLTIRFAFAAEDGSTASCVVIGEGMDTGDKASNKAMAVALKYALSQMLLLPYGEVDPDADTPALSTRKGRTIDPGGESGPLVKDEPAAKTHTDGKTPADKPGTDPFPPADAKPQMAPGIPHALVIVGEVGTKTGTSNKGPWTRYYTKASDGQFYSTFDKPIGEQLADLEGQTVDIIYSIKKTAKGESREIKSLAVVGAQSGADNQDGEKPADDLPYN